MSEYVKKLGSVRLEHDLLLGVPSTDNITDKVLKLDGAGVLGWAVDEEGQALPATGAVNDGLFWDGGAWVTQLAGRENFVLSPGELGWSLVRVKVDAPIMSGQSCTVIVRFSGDMRPTPYTGSATYQGFHSNDTVANNGLLASDALNGIRIKLALVSDGQVPGASTGDEDAAGQTALTAAGLNNVGSWADGPSPGTTFGPNSGILDGVGSATVLLNPLKAAVGLIGAFDINTTYASGSGINDCLRVTVDSPYVIMGSPTGASSTKENYCGTIIVW